MTVRRETLDLLASWNYQKTIFDVITLTVAYLLALPIGWNREREDRSAGIRTFPLVSMAVCGFVIVAVRVLGAGDASQSNVMAGLITGVGFIGGGAILQMGDKAKGTATAACIWATGALGASIGYGLYDIAVALSVLIYFSLRVAAPLKKVANNGAEDNTVD